MANIREREKKEKEVKPETHLRLGVGEVLLGRYQSGLEHLKKAGELGMACYLPGPRAGEPAAVRRRPPRRSRQAAKHGYDAKNSELHRAGALRRAGQDRRGQEDPRRAARSRARSSAEYHFQQGCLLAADGRAGRGRRRVREDAQPRQGPQRRALRAGLHQRPLRQRRPGVEYYRRCTDRPPVPLAAWINLGILYEDEMRFREAEQCYRHVLAHEPNHPRARLFFKDCQASKEMYYDEEAERGYTVLKQLHEIPVTDFELSVRSRNCLRKMNIRTLGDLTRTTEAALLASKNFGETSLAEIKEMMQAKGLRLGMALEGKRTRPATTTGSSSRRKFPPRCRRSWTSRSATSTSRSGPASA